MSVSFYGGFIPGTMGGGSGSDGRGIASVTIDENGQMIIKYTDGKSENIGPVIGPRGYTFTPQIQDNILSWSNDGNLPNPDPFELPTSSSTAEDDVWGNIGDETPPTGDLTWNEII